MLLVDCLAKVAPDVLRRMARHAVVEAGSRRDLEAALAVRLSDPEWLSATLDHLAPAHWQALKVVYWGGAGRGITVELCHQVVCMLAGRRRQGANQAVQALLDRGLVFTGKQGYREVYLIPDEILPTLQPRLAVQMAARVQVPAPAHGPDPGAPDLVEDLCRFLAYVYKTEVQLTQQGILFKRHLRALTDLLGLDAAEGGEDDLMPGRYPEPLGFVAGFSLDQHLVMRDDGALKPGGNLAQWLRRSDDEWRAALFHYWRERYDHPDLQAFLHLLHTLGPVWISLAAATRELEPVLHPSQRAPLAARLRHHLMHFLAPLGVMDVATGDDGDMVCRLTPAGQALLGASGRVPEPGAETDRFVLQPTGEVVAPRPMPVSVLWHLEVLADLAQRGPALVYRVNRETIYRALRSGYRADQIVAFLARHSDTGLPQNLAFDIRSWGRAYGQVYFQEVCLLRCTDPVLAQQIKAGRRTGPYIHGEIAPTALIIRRGDYEPLMQALLADGMLPRPGIESVSPTAKAAGAGETAQDLPVAVGDSVGPRRL